MPPSSAGRHSNGWQVYEEESFNTAVAQCGSHQFFDVALAPLEYALHRNPLAFEEVPGVPGVRLARTTLRLNGLEIIPSYRLWFRLDEARRKVAKLWVEIAPPEDMGLADDLWSEGYG